jgi:O-methyltransferase
MRAVLHALGDPDRCVWAADSFEGLPKPRPEHPQDEGDEHWTFGQLAIPLETVQANFARYGLLDERVRFLPGWFSESLPDAPVERIAVLRIDADMYGSTMDVLTALHARVSPHGFVIVDDYGSHAPCAAAVRDFRAAHGVDDALVGVDAAAVCWQRGGPADERVTASLGSRLGVPEEA